MLNYPRRTATAVLKSSCIGLRRVVSREEVEEEYPSIPEVEIVPSGVPSNSIVAVDHNGRVVGGIKNIGNPGEKKP